jgi:hypothetical protein
MSGAWPASSTTLSSRSRCRERAVALELKSRRRGVDEGDAPHEHLGRPRLCVGPMAWRRSNRDRTKSRVPSSAAIDTIPSGFLGSSAARLELGGWPRREQRAKLTCSTWAAAYSNHSEAVPLTTGLYYESVGDGTMLVVPYSKERIQTTRRFLMNPGFRQHREDFVETTVKGLRNEPPPGRLRERPTMMTVLGTTRVERSGRRMTARPRCVYSTSNTPRAARGPGSCVAATIARW